jgi:TRAP-type C4-dicarboxylate transport system permease small subunit
MERIVQAIDRVVDKTLDYLVVSSVNVLLFAISIAIFVTVVTRYVFGFSYAQVQEFSILFFVWIVFIMAGKIVREDKHISINLLPERLVSAGKLRTKAALDIYISITLIAFGIIFIYVGILDTIIYYKSGYHSILKYVPYYWTRHMALPVGSAILTYYGIRKLSKDIHSLIQLSKRKS